MRTQRVNEGNYDFAVTADFDNINGYLAYRDDPAHRAIVAAYVAPITGRRAAVQFEFTVLARGDDPPEPPAALCWPGGATPRNPPLRYAPRGGTRRHTGRSPGTKARTRWAGMSASP